MTRVSYKANIVIFDPERYRPTADRYNPTNRGVRCVCEWDSGPGTKPTNRIQIWTDNPRFVPQVKRM